MTQASQEPCFGADSNTVPIISWTFHILIERHDSVPGHIQDKQDKKLQSLNQMKNEKHLKCQNREIPFGI